MKGSEHVAAEPRVTVLMPVYQAERWLADAVRSVLAQTFEDLELLAVDDGSSDASLEILEGFAKRDRRMRVVHRPHAGLVGALNFGLEQARGHYVARLDADDVALPHRLARQLARLDAEPDLVLLGGAFDVIDARDRLIHRLEPPTEHDEIVAWLLRGRSPIQHSTAVYRRHTVLEAGGYDEGARFVEDLDLWLRLSETGRLANLADVVTRYRVHRDAVSEVNQQQQLVAAQRVCVRAWQRRGLRGTPDPPPAWRPGRDRASRQRFALDWARMAWRMGERRTALGYAARAVRVHPLGAAPWRLAARLATKRFRRRK